MFGLSESFFFFVLGFLRAHFIDKEIHDMHFAGFLILILQDAPFGVS